VRLKRRCRSASITLIHYGLAAGPAGIDAVCAGRGPSADARQGPFALVEMARSVAEICDERPEINGAKNIEGLGFEPPCCMDRAADVLGRVAWKTVRPSERVLTLLVWIASPRSPCGHLRSANLACSPKSVVPLPSRPPRMSGVPFKALADHRPHIPKQQHRVTKWSDYDAALRQRGSLTVWFTDEAIAAWGAEPRTARGRQPHYSALAIPTALTLRAVYRQPLRQAARLSMPTRVGCGRYQTNQAVRPSCSACQSKRIFGTWPLPYRPTTE
jgi:hypothetical protein